MKQLPFQRPTTHYDERTKHIDEQICQLIKERKKISNNNPGFPLLEYISDWAGKFELYESFLQSIFGVLFNEEFFRPFVEPEGFRMYLPVSKVIEKDNRIFSVTFIRQYTNASVVNFNVDWEAPKESPADRTPHNHFELYLGQTYDCRMSGGTGGMDHFSYSFIVTPALPDDFTGIDLVFKEFKYPFKGRVLRL